MNFYAQVYQYPSRLQGGAERGEANLCSPKKWCLLLASLF